MIRIRINPKKASDVTTMYAKGWRVSIFREAKSENEMVVVEKDVLRFVMTIMSMNRADEGEPPVRIQAVQIKKFVHGYFVDSRIFLDTGSGINGTICISEGRTVETTYAFFRSEELQKLIEEFDIKRVAFPKDTTAYRFEKQIIIPNDTIVDSHTMPEFHTDGTYQLIKTPDGDNAWLVSNATYVYEYKIRTLTIPWEYNLMHVREIMKDLTA